MLEEKRKQKVEELDQKCTTTILSRFSCVIAGKTYYFSNDNEAQKNFDKAARAFDKGLTNSLPWTAYDGGGQVTRVTISKLDFETLYLAHLMHIQDNIAKFRDTLLPKVMAAKTEADLNTIQW